MKAQQQIWEPNVERRRNRQLWAGLYFWLIAAAILIGFLWVQNGLSEANNGVYLMPWIIFTGAVVLSPTIYLLYNGKFDLFHPLVFAAWSYIFPAFVIGGVIISLGLANPFVMGLIEDPQRNIPYSLVLVVLGFLGMVIGYAVPFGGYLARKIDGFLPEWHWQASQLWLPGFILMLTGLGVNVIGLIQGSLGYQIVTEVGTFDSMWAYLSVIFTVGNVLLWLAVFYTREKRLIYYVTLVVLLTSIPLRMALLGSRSSLVLSVMSIIMAYLYSGRKLTMRLSVVLASVGALAIIVGTVYGTSFRSIKGSEARVELDEYTAKVGETVEHLTRQDASSLVEASLQPLADRVENLSSLAVVVSNYERLTPFEASYGLENNIVNDATTSFVPRFMWPDKPRTSDARAYSDLYFNFSENSFAISPFGDLLRNFGPYGVLPGMILVGLYLRVIYSVLIKSPNTTIWRKAAYFPLLTVVSYEAFYALIFPSLIRTLAVLAVSLLIANLLMKRIRH